MLSAPLHGTRGKTGYAAPAIVSAWGSCRESGIGMTAFEPDESEEDKAVRMKLGLLRQEHRDLDSAIQALSDASARDQLLLARLKKKKLALKDQILQLENQLIPDIIA